MNRFGALVACIFVLALPVRGAVAAPVVIDTIPSWNGTSSIGEFGAVSWSAWGQFFQAPVGTHRLLDFSLLISDGIQGEGSTPVPVQFQAHLVRFNPTQEVSTRRTVGPLLYSSDVITVPLTDALQFEKYTFSIDVAVTGGETYMLFLFATNYTDIYTPQLRRDSRARLATNNTDLIEGAYNVPLVADNSLDGVLSDSWRFFRGDDLVFSATFDTQPTAVPEPAGGLLLAMAGGAGWWASRRRPSVSARADRRPPALA